jgi:hypothetical protein
MVISQDTTRKVLREYQYIPHGVPDEFYDTSTLEEYDRTLQSYVKRPFPGEEDKSFCELCNSSDFAKIADIDMTGPEPYDRTEFGTFKHRTVFNLSNETLNGQFDCPLCSIFRLFRD